MYQDQDVHRYIQVTGQNLDDFKHYAVVPKLQSIANKSLLRYDRKENPFSDEVMRLYDIAGDWLDKEFGPALANSRVISYDETIEWLDPDKSPGLPWTGKYQYKCDYWDSENSHFFVKYWDALKTQNYIRSLCSVTIKEEVRTWEKVVNEDGRTIVPMDVNHIVAHCMLCLDQNRRLIATHMQHSIVLGINTMRGGFHLLNAKMMRFGDVKATIALDGKKFDGRFRKYCFDKIRDCRWRMLRKKDRIAENYTRLYNLYYELSHAPLVNVDGRVYGRQAGNPSGQACTTPDNSFKNFMDVVVLWHLIMPEKYHTYEAFSYHLVLCINGDDINISVHPDVQHLFNQAAIERVMVEIDMEYYFENEEFDFNFNLSFLGHKWQQTSVPGLDGRDGLSMYLPVIDCVKMRTNLLIYNEKQTRENTIVRACGLRNETFACVECRDWFKDFLDWLRSECYGSETPEMVVAWKNYLTDNELWRIYTGLEPVVVATRPEREYRLADRSNDNFSVPALFKTESITVNKTSAV